MLGRLRGLMQKVLLIFALTLLWGSHPLYSQERKFNDQNDIEKDKWAGGYVGAHAGISSLRADPSGFNSSLADSTLLSTGAVKDILRSTINFNSTTNRDKTFGLFGGVNWQWEEVVLGLEADLSHSAFSANKNLPLTTFVRQEVVSDIQHTLTREASARAKVTDWATLRGRVGYDMVDFMPYITFGVAGGRIRTSAELSGNWSALEKDTRTTITVNGASVDNPNYNKYVFANGSGNFNGKISKGGNVIGGVFGLGVDAEIIPNVLIRAEWQHIQFASSISRWDLSFDTIRAGAAMRF